MAETVVSFVIETLASAVKEEIGLLVNFRKEVTDIMYELKIIKAHIEDAEKQGEKEDQRGVAKVWLEELRHVAFEIEDLLDEYMLRHQMRLPRIHGHGTCGLLNKMKHFFNHWMERRDLASRIQDIKSRIKNVSIRKQRYEASTTSFSGTATEKLVRDPRADALFLKESDIVGIKKPKDKLIRWLVEQKDLNVGVVSVFGPGGLGKTTLVKKVFDDQKVKAHFPYRVWITVSETFAIKRLLINLILGASAEDETTILLPRLENSDITYLKEVMHNSFQHKRYIIVLDDVWQLDAWKDIKCALPDSGCGSRIIVTTRSQDIANACIENSGYPYELPLLKPDDAKKLFEKVAFRSYVANYSTQRLNELSQIFLAKCKGLPLAIVAIAGLLSTKTAMEWERINEDWGSLLHHPQLGDLSTILSLSYNDLPYHLKACLLYFSLFPEDYWIRSSRLLHLWAAEGFVDVETKLVGMPVNLTKEDVAQSYLDELISRSLVQVKSSKYYRKVTTCGIHDLLREFLVKKACEQEFVRFFVKQRPEIELSNERVRRLSIISKESDAEEHKWPKNFTLFSHVRSLFAFGEGSLFISSSVSMFLSGGARLLKVLDLESAPIQELPGEALTDLFFLRYLSLRNSNISSLPSSLGKLINLETLELRDTKVRELPLEILELKRLRHLLVSGIRLPEGIGRLNTLEKIFWASVHGSIGKELAKLTRLRSLCIEQLDEENARDVFASIEKMEYLFSCRLAVQDPDNKILRGNVSCPPLLLNRLLLSGLLDATPHWILSLKNLTLLRLYRSKLKDFYSFFEGLQMLLPNLVALLLDRAFDGVRDLTIKTGGFPSLKELSMRDLCELELITIEEGAMPCMLDIWLTRCEKLGMVLGIEYVTTLYQIDLTGVNTQLPNKMINHIWKAGHSPLIMSGGKRWKGKQSWEATES